MFLCYGGWTGLGQDLDDKVQLKPFNMWLSVSHRQQHLRLGAPTDSLQRRSYNLNGQNLQVVVCLQLCLIQSGSSCCPVSESSCWVNYPTDVLGDEKHSYGRWALEWRALRAFNQGTWRRDIFNQSFLHPQPQRGNCLLVSVVYECSKSINQGSVALQNSA